MQSTVSPIDFNCSCDSNSSASQIPRYQTGTQKMRNTQIMTVCEKPGLNNLSTITRGCCGRGRDEIQFNLLHSIAFNMRLPFLFLWCPDSFHTTFQFLQLTKQGS